MALNIPIRNAFVLGAGLGTRLRTLTARKPKPLLPICQKPLITFAFDHLIRTGAEKIVVNTHHCHQAYDEVFRDKKYRGVPLHFEYEPAVLETGGGIKNAEPRLRNATFIVYNGDILSDLPLERAVQAHFERRNEVTMVLRSQGGAPLHIALDDDTGRVLDIANRLQTGKPARYMFTGIYIVNPSFLFRIPSRTKISVIPIFVHMIQRGHPLGGVVVDEGQWWDIGTRDHYLDVHRYFSQPHFSFNVDRSGTGAGAGGGTNGASWPQWIHPSAQLASSAKIEGYSTVGAGAAIGHNARLVNSVVWENAVVAPGSVLHNCIVTAGQTASGTHTNMDF